MSTAQDDMASSPGIRSQCSSDGSRHDDESLSISQAPFATQLPIPEPSNEDVRSLENPYAVASDRGEIATNYEVTDLLYTEDALRNAIEPKISATSIHNISALSPRSAPNESHSSTSQHMSKQVKPSQAAIQDEVLEQEPLIAPSTLLDQSDTDTDSSDEASINIFPSMPIDLFSSANVAREHSIAVATDGRIALRMIEIPQDQQKLLRSNEKWFPPLIGSSGKPATVPLALQNALSVQANRLARQILPAEVQNSTLYNEPSTTKDHSYKSPIGSPSSCASTSSSSDELDSSQWSNSPIRSARPRLPPDSPHQGAMPTSVPAADVEVYEPEVALQASVDNLVENLQPPSVRDLSGDIQTSRLMSNLPANSSRRNVNETFDSAQSASQKLSDTLESGKRGSVHVDRTPYPVRPGNTTVTPDTTTHVIPGTYHDSATPSTKYVQNEDPHSTIDELQASALRSFEEDSSEDQIASFEYISAQRPSSKVRRYESKHTSPIVIADTTRSPTLIDKPSYSSFSQKRTQNEEDSSQLRSAKRSRTDREQDVHDTLHRSQDNNEDRRIERAHPYRGQQNTSSIQDQDSPSSRARSLSHKSVSYKRHDERQNPVASRRNDHETDHLLTLQTEKRARTDLRPDASQRASQISPSFSDAHQTLYVRFQTVYPDYFGKISQFVAACRLLKDVRAKTRLHPSLWDAFVFRHHHDYRNYLQEVIEEAGTAMSYPEYFDLFEDPGCQKKAITPDILNALPEVALNDVTTRFKKIPPLISSPVGPNGSVSDEKHEIQMTSSPHGSVVANEDSAVAINMPALNSVIETPNPADSVKMWLNKSFLEKASGARSPILGSQEIDESASSGVKQPKSTSKSPILQKSAIRHNVQKNPDFRGKVAGTSVLKPSITRSAIRHVEQDILTSAVKSQLRRKPPIDTPFRRFARDYNELPDMKLASTISELDHFEMVDIFRWRG